MGGSSVLNYLLATPLPEAVGWIGATMGIAAFIGVVLHLGMWREIWRAGAVTKQLREVEMDTRTPEQHRQVIANFDAAFANTPLARTWREFRRRRDELCEAAPEERAPVRFADVIEERPILTQGAKLAAAKEMPRAFVALGAAMAALTFAAYDGPGAFPLATLAIFSAVALAAFCTFFLRMLDGRAASLVHDLDQRIETIFPSLSREEFATQMAHAQREGFDRVARELSESARKIGDEQRTAMLDITKSLTNAMHEGVEGHLDQLRQAIIQTVDQQGVVAEGLITTYDRLRESQESQSRVTEEIDDLLTSLADAARHIEEAGQGATPLLTNLRDASEQVAQAAGSIEDLQAETIKKVSETAPAIESLRGSFARVESELASLTPISDRLSELDASADNVAMSLHGVSERMGNMESTLEDMSKTFSSEGHDLRRAMSTLGSELTEASTSFVQQPRGAKGGDDEPRDALDLRDESLHTPLETDPYEEDEEPALETDPEPAPAAVPEPTTAPGSEFTTLVARSEALEAATTPEFDSPAAPRIDTPLESETEGPRDSAMQALAAPIDDPESSAGDGLATPGSGFAGLLSRYRSTDEAPAAPETEVAKATESAAAIETPSAMDAASTSDDRDAEATVRSPLDEAPEVPSPSEPSDSPVTESSAEDAEHEAEAPSAPPAIAEPEAAAVGSDSSESKLLSDTDYAATAYSTVQRRKEKVSVRTRKRKSRKAKKAERAAKAESEASIDEAAVAETATDEDGQKEARLSRFFGED